MSKLTNIKPRNWRIFYGHRPVTFTISPRPYAELRKMESAYVEWLMADRQWSHGEAMAHINAMDKRKLISATHGAAVLPLQVAVAVPDAIIAATPVPLPTAPAMATTAATPRKLAASRVANNGSGFDRVMAELMNRRAA